MSFFLQGIGLKILGWAVIAGAVLAVLFGARNAGRKAERVESMEKSLENARRSREIERDIRAAPDDAVDDFLRPPDRRRPVH